MVPWMNHIIPKLLLNTLFYTHSFSQSNTVRGFSGNVAFWWCYLPWCKRPPLLNILVRTLNVTCMAVHMSAHITVCSFQQAVPLDQGELLLLSMLHPHHLGHDLQALGGRKEGV